MYVSSCCFPFLLALRFRVSAFHRPAVFCVMACLSLVCICVLDIGVTELKVLEKI